ncbi:MAG: hypothetical protein JKY31_01925 [Rhodobacteraceae bacterium]|nr:hypothetical protein [Paracoccaceae bacterium]
MGFADVIKIALELDNIRNFANFTKDADKVGKDLKKKMKSGKSSEITYDDFNFFKNKHMSKALKQLKAIRKTAEKANKTKHVWPEYKFKKEHNAARDLIKNKKKGPEHKETKAALDKYHLVLAIAVVNLAASNKRMKTTVKEIEKRIKNAELTGKYMGMLNKDLMKIVKFSVLTSMQAQFFVLSQEALELKKVSGSILTTYKSVLKKVKALIKESEFRIGDLETRAKYVSDGGMQFEYGPDS